MFIITPGNHNNEEIAPIDVDCPFTQCRTKLMKASAEETSMRAAWAFASLQSSSSDSAHCLVWAIHSQTCNRSIFDSDEATAALLPALCRKGEEHAHPKVHFLYSKVFRFRSHHRHSLHPCKHFCNVYEYKLFRGTKILTIENL